jgi:transcription elongation factor GreA
LVTGEETQGKSETLIVSWPSFERQRAELEEIINKKIPENSRAIGQARSYGDLSENFEFKAAKEAQRMLQRRRAELERDLSHARASYFEEATTDHVGVGNRVKVTEIDSGAEKVYSILGAWDSDPQRGIISYLSPVAKALLGKSVGNEVDVETENNRHRLRVESIEKISKEFLEKL